MEEDILKIINHYGIDKQLKYIHTEYYELDEAIIQYENVENNKFSAYKNHIAEELADIMVMLEQFRLYYGISKETIKEVMGYKIDRQLKRINEGI